MYTKEDLKKIGKNIKAIREAYGCKNIEDFNTYLNEPKGLSQSTIRDIEKGNYNLSEENIFRLSELTGFTYEEIVFDNLWEILEPNSLVLDKNESPLDFFCDPELTIDFCQAFFPFNNTSELKDNEEYNKALEQLNAFIKEIKNKQLISSMPLKEVMDALTNVYGETGNEQAVINLLSIFGWGYLLTIDTDPTTINFVKNRIDDNSLDFLEKNSRIINTKQYQERRNERKKAVLGENEEFLNFYQKVLMNGDNSDFSYYYIAIRYYLGMYDEKDTKLTEKEMHRFGFILLQNLNKLGNKYASAFIKFYNQEN